MMLDESPFHSSDPSLYTLPTPYRSDGGHSGTGAQKEEESRTPDCRSQASCRRRDVPCRLSSLIAALESKHSHAHQRVGTVFAVASPA